MVITSEQNELNKKIMGIAHEVAEKFHEQSWNELARLLTPYLPLDGNTILSALSTFVSAFSARFVITMKKEIVDADDTGYDLRQIADAVNSGVIAFLSLNKEV